MAREKQGYRDVMERLDKMFPDQEMLNIKQTAQFCGCSRDTARRMIRFNAMKRITKPELARQVCI